MAKRIRYGTNGCIVTSAYMCARARACVCVRVRVCACVCVVVCASAARVWMAGRRDCLYDWQRHLVDMCTMRGVEFYTLAPSP